MHISEEHIYRWECPICGNNAGCDYNHCWLAPDTDREKEADMVMNNTPLTPLDRGEMVDLERMNFIAWHRDAMVEEIVIARRNNAAKLDELTRKYEAEINLMEIIMPPRRDTERRVPLG